MPHATKRYGFRISLSHCPPVILRLTTVMDTQEKDLKGGNNYFGSRFSSPKSSVSITLVLMGVSWWEGDAAEKVLLLTDVVKQTTFNHSLLVVIPYSDLSVLHPFLCGGCRVAKII